MAAEVFGVEDAFAKRGAKRFEYVRVQASSSYIVQLDEPAQRLGEAGWELCTAVHTDTYVHLWFKREVT